MRQCDAWESRRGRCTSSRRNRSPTPAASRGRRPFAPLGEMIAQGDGRIKRGQGAVRDTARLHEPGEMELGHGLGIRLTVGRAADGFADPPGKRQAEGLRNERYRAFQPADLHAPRIDVGRDAVPGQARGVAEIVIMIGVSAASNSSIRPSQPKPWGSGPRIAQTLLGDLAAKAVARRRHVEPSGPACQ